ncbi:MAG: molybdenum cofactor biosynthesis protein MoaE, partial [Alphaproteobacteria bacterium]
MTIRVQREDFSIGEEAERLAAAHGGAGAVVTFTGVVRESADGPRLTAMTLEHYPGMTENALKDIAAEARRRFDLLDLLVIHRYGRLEPGDNIVLVVTVSAHRGEAFRAAEFLMDWLKTKAPFWKREETDAG